MDQRCQNHNQDRILCLNSKCRDYNEQWTCNQCYNNNYYGDHKHIVDQSTDRYKTHFKNEIEFKNNYQRLIQIKWDSIIKIEKEESLINQSINYLRQMLEEFEANKSKTVDNLKQQLYSQILYIQNISYFDITRQEIEELEKIQQSSICNYENYIYHNLSNTVSQLIDILVLQIIKLKEQISQIDIKNREKQQHIFQQQEKVQQKPKNSLIEVRSISSSYDEKYIVSGGDAKQLALFRVQTQLRIKLNEISFDEPIRIVDFIRQPTYPYQVAVLSDQIKIFEIDFTQLNQLKEIKTIFKKKDCNDIKSIQFIDESHLIIIGRSRTYIYNINSNQVIQNTKLNITDIDVCQIQNKILIGHKNGLFYFGEFRTQEYMISSTIFEQESNSIQKQVKPIIQVKIQRNGYRFLTCHANRYNDEQKINQQNNYVKIWNFQCEEILQLQINFLHANFIGQKQLFIIFTQDNYQIFNYKLDCKQKPQASRIIGDKTMQIKTQSQSIIRDDPQLTSIFTIEYNQLIRYLEDTNVFSNNCQIAQFTPLETEQE